MPQGTYRFISLHNHTMRREYLVDDVYQGISIGEAVPIQYIHAFGLAEHLDFQGYASAPIDVYDTYAEVPEVLPAGKFLVMLADVPSGRYWIPIVAEKLEESKGLFDNKLCLHF